MVVLHVCKTIEPVPSARDVYSCKIAASFMLDIDPHTTRTIYDKQGRPMLTNCSTAQSTTAPLHRHHTTHERPRTAQKPCNRARQWRRQSARCLRSVQACTGHQRALPPRPDDAAHCCRRCCGPSRRERKSRGGRPRGPPRGRRPASEGGFLASFSFCARLPADILRSEGEVSIESASVR